MGNYTPPPTPASLAPGGNRAGSFDLAGLQHRHQLQREARHSERRALYPARQSDHDKLQRHRSGQRHKLLLRSFGAEPGWREHQLGPGRRNAQPPQPRVVGISIVGGSLVFGGTNGPANGAYRILSSTNMAAPLANWTQVGSGYFDGNGSFSATNAINPGETERFYLLSQP